MNVLLVKSDKDVAASIAFLLESEINAKVKEAYSLSEGLAELLDDTQKFDLLICDDNGENIKIFKFLLTGDMQIRCLVLKDPKVPAVLAFPDLILAYVNPSNVADELKTVFAEKLAGAKPAAREGEDKNYCKIRALTILQKPPLIFDLYVRLSSQKYVRVFKKGDTYTEKDIKNFLETKKIEYLYCEKADASALANKLKEDMERDFKAASADSPEAATRSAAHAHEAVIELGNRIGFTPEVQALAKQGMMATIKTINNGKPQLSKIIRNIIANKDQYSGSHAVLTAQIACSLATLVSWSSETTIQKLTFAAFFHDMIITNNTLAQVKSLEELEKRRSEFTEDEYKRFKAHPNVVAQIINTFSEVPADVNLIISQHHERPDGSGFPRGLQGPNIAPLATLFIIAHDIVDYIFENGTKGIEEFFAVYRVKNTAGHFKKILALIDLGKIGIGQESSSIASSTKAG